MTALKLVFLLGFFTIALGFTLPADEDGHDPVLVRDIRSPQKIEANVDHSDQHGSSASLKYTQPLGDNFEAYAKASRDFRHNDNKGEIGLQYSF